ncbi:MAG: DUF362 domain-containing protein [Thermodesulfobacteriota bacterium]
MKRDKEMSLDSAIGSCKPDAEGSIVGVVRLDPNAAHVGVPQLLQTYINGADPEAWDKIRAKIDYICSNLGWAIDPVEQETGFSGEIRSGIKNGRKLFFKPNLVSMTCIDPETHGPDRAVTACLEWSFLAALMRWFHDRMGVRYSEMAMGEAATMMSSAAATYTMLHPQKKRITPQAAIEGKIDDYYCGWGFYFVRKYLKESLPSSAGPADDPMAGYEESVSGTYIPPGLVRDKLMVYDLNRIVDNLSKGRDIDVADGEYFRTITLHKAVVGGNPKDKEDCKLYPGSILINVPRLKVHNCALLTAAVKNLGIGLYPMESARTEEGYDYSLPRTGIPGLKGGISHQPWVPEMSEDGFPKRDSEGNYVATKTAGLTAAMIDIIQAVRSQSIPTFHVLDAIQPTNLDHQGMLPGVAVPEGLVFAGADPVAVDLAAARYIYSNVSMEEAHEAALDDGFGGRFAQRIPIPFLEGGQIVTRNGYDCPIARDFVMVRSEERGLGQRKYCVAGKDMVTGRPIVSVEGRIGTVDGIRFDEIVTKELYFDVFKFPWDMQQTFLNYLDATDRLERGSGRKKIFLEDFDEDGDGSISYEEVGKKGHVVFNTHWGAQSNSISATEPLGHLKGTYITRALGLKCWEPKWNPRSHSFMREILWGGITLTAYRMSQSAREFPDLFSPGLVWGQGKWPSFQMAVASFLAVNLYGSGYPKKASAGSLYGIAFVYADRSQNEGKYSGVLRSRTRKGALEAYLADLAAGAKPLDFTVYFPKGFELLGGKPAPNVITTDDPAKLLTASFLGGKEIWGAV